MDLMSGKTSYPELRRKYDKMQAPTLRVRVDGVELDRKLGCRITDLVVELTSGYEASGCSFAVIGEYDLEKTGFRSRGAVKYLQVGAVVEVEVGYIRTEPVFYGCVTEVAYQWAEDNAPEIHVVCTDAKCQLMKTQRMEILSETKLTQAVSALLGEKPASSYLKGRKVDQIPLQCEMIRLPLESDYEFLVRYAEYTGCEFFILQGKAYFREAPRTSSPIMTLSMGKGLLAAQASLRGGRLVKEVEVVGIDPETDRPVTGKAMLRGRFSKGSTAARSYENTCKSYFDEGVTSAREAGKRAQVLMQGLQKDFMVLRCRCLGIPELVPGRTVTIKGLDPSVEKQWYVSRVRHTMDERGFLTEIEARDDQL